MRLLPKSIHWCRRYPTKFNSGRDIPCLSPCCGSLILRPLGVGGTLSRGSKSPLTSVVALASVDEAVGSPGPNRSVMHTELVSILLGG